MNCAPSPEKQQALLSEILAFVSRSRGLKCVPTEMNRSRISQTIDGKSIEIDTNDLDAVLSRSDTEGQEFLQINFVSGKKILVTNSLIGFKPLALRGIDLAKLPRVVTTPDVASVFDAIQDALHAVDADIREVAVLKRVFEAVIAGGEAVGFDLSNEKAWLARLPSSLSRTAS